MTSKQRALHLLIQTNRLLGFNDDTFSDTTIRVSLYLSAVIENESKPAPKTWKYWNEVRDYIEQHKNKTI
jgi:hypothetical protein